MEALNTIYKNLIDRTDTSMIRYLYHEINWDSKLIAITGARGTGKTTMILQKIKLSNQKNESLYVSADNIYFSKNTLFDLAQTFHNYGGKYIYIDEVHKYTDWSREIKNIYDSFPDLKIVFTGSSILDIYKGFGDLSRRVVPYHLHGMSFREYLYFETGKVYPVKELKDILSNNLDVDLKTPLLYFQNYLKQGYYPFYKEDDFHLRLNGAINAILEIDIPKYLELKASTIDKLKRLLQIIAENVPFKPNISKLSDLLEISRTLLPNYFSYLERAGLIMQLHDTTKGIRALGKVQKVYLNNTNLMNAFSGDKTNIGTMRETFFMNQLILKHKTSLPDKGDFIIDDNIFEIGGKNKTGKQIQGLSNAYIVKDDIEHGFGNTIPLWHFGFLY
jgi:predicted AAA+ superfamily ATPase